MVVTTQAGWAGETVRPAPGSNACEASHQRLVDDLKDLQKEILTDLAEWKAGRVAELEREVEQARGQRLRAEEALRSQDEEWRQWTVELEQSEFSGEQRAAFQAAKSDTMAESAAALRGQMVKAIDRESRAAGRLEREKERLRRISQKLAAAQHPH